jgi:SAM-dependent methyltransferase
MAADGGGAEADAAVQAFTGKVFGMIAGGVSAFMIDLGLRTGLFDAASGAGPLTSGELAVRAGLDERYVREWLAAMTTAGVFRLDGDRFELPAAHAVCLSGESGRNVAPRTQMVGFLAQHLESVARAFRDGAGVPYSAFRPGFTGLMDRLNRFRYDQLLVSGYLAAADGLIERLDDGIAVADIGCGSGHCLNIMAGAFPKSRFVGFDIADDAIADGEAEAAQLGLSNARFEVRDVTALPAATFDLITAFDAIHDQAAPDRVLRRAREALVDDGVFLAIDVKASSNLAGNLDHPLGPYLYGVSVMHCMSVSLADGGPGLGTMWGRELATRMFHDAGFSTVEECPAPPQDAVNAIYVCRP